MSQPTLQQIMSLFVVCAFCKQRAHPKNNVACDECKDHLEADRDRAIYEAAFDNYGSGEE